MPPLRELDLPARPVPHALAAALVRGQGPDADYFLYCGRDELRFASDWSSAVTVSTDRVTLEREGRVVHSEPASDPLAQVGQLLRSSPLANWTAYGYLAFDLTRFYHPYAWAREEPSLRLCVPRLEVVVRGNRAHVQAADDPDRIVELLGGIGRGAGGEFARPPTPVASAGDDRALFCSRVVELQAAIKAGKLDKAILSRRRNVAGRLALLETYAAAASVNSRAPRSYCFRMGAIGAVGFSPEIVLQSDGQGRIVTNPLAGTRPRGASPAEDARLRADLFHNAKEVKEHAISVILSQQEFRSVCRPRTVRVTGFMGLKRFPYVQHLSSHVRGCLAPGRDVWDAVRAVFPAVTVSGIPKREALEWIGKLEGEPRGVYGGAVGWVDSQGRIDLALAIRSVFQYGDTFQLSAGAGILAESQPDQEYDESVMKMNTMAGRVVLAAGP